MVTPDRRWAIGSNQYVKRLRAGKPDAQEGASLPALDNAQGTFDALGVTWDRSLIFLDAIPPSTTDRARARLRAQLPELVWNAAALEGNTYTLPEVRTLLEGVTVGGKPVEDAKQILALSEAFSDLDNLLARGEFRLDKITSDRLHGLVARDEAIESGAFRGEGVVSGGGHVRLSDGSRVDGVEHGPGGQLLIERFERARAFLDGVDDPRLAALAYFASATRSQFYFDGNKRTARLMMAGHLMANGFEAVSVPAARRLEFNLVLDHLFATNDAAPLMAFLAACAIV